MTMDPSEKDALLYVPNAGLTDSEQLGLTSKDDRFTRTDGTHLGVPQGYETDAMDPFNRLDQFTKLQKPPEIKFKDLDAIIDSHISFNVLPMKVRVDYLPITEATVLTNITVQFANKDLQFQSKDGVQRALVELTGRITTMARRRQNSFEETVRVDAPPEMLEQYARQVSLYQAVVPMPPGTYRLNVAAKDMTANTVAIYEVALERSASGSGQALFEHAGAGGPDRGSAPQEYWDRRFLEVRDRQFEGAAAGGRDLHAQREAGHLHEGVQLRAGRADPQALRRRGVRNFKERVQ